VSVLITRRDLLAAGGAAGLAALTAAVAGRAALLDGAGRSRQAVPSAYEKAVLASRPTAWWRLGEKGGPTARDAMKKHDGKYHGKVTFGRKGAIKHDPSRAVELAGKAYVKVPDSKAFSQPTSGKGLSVEAWMRPGALAFDGEGGGPEGPYVHWLGKGDKGRHEWTLRFYSSKSEKRANWISAYVFSPSGGLGTGAHFTGPVKAGQWLHLVACFDPGDKDTPGAGVRLYVNGVLRQGPPAKGTLYSSFGVLPKHGTAPLHLGTRDLTSFLRGGLDEVAIYPRVLTAAEVLDNYVNGIS